MSRPEPLGIPRPESQPGETFDEFLVVERTYSDDPSNVSVGLASIHADVPAVERNKDKILRAAQRFKQSGVNVAIFPEFALSGYFWEDEAECRPYMEAAAIENHRDWIEGELMPLLDADFRAIVLNGLTRTTGADHKLHNSTFVVAQDHDYLDPRETYQKVFLPGIEKLYTESGRDDRLVLRGVKQGRIGFATCYDYLFGELLREYAVIDGVDALVEVASWRAAATRDYPLMNVRTDLYYGELWDLTMAAASATNQVWTIACNAVGRHPVSDVAFWGGSGIWAPSGIPLVQASNINEELLIVHNLNIQETRAAELDDFNYAFDFNEIYRRHTEGSTFTRKVD
ncbi:MAG TPA: carbon-nitrogen hydrolase family protein [Solirubrobacterales bacterium]|nr:carbon-nitrogen hydrolase family protein [Solirubrobacterales bacterium]